MTTYCYAVEGPTVFQGTARSRKKALSIAVGLIRCAYHMVPVVWTAKKERWWDDEDGRYYVTVYDVKTHIIPRESMDHG